MVTVPTAGEAAALRLLGLLRSDELPSVAAHLLVDLDTPALRRVAGLDPSDVWLIDNVWREAVAELGVGESDPEQAWAVAARYLVESYRTGERLGLEILRAVARLYVEIGYPAWAPDAAHIYVLEDELDGGWGRSPGDVITDAIQSLERFSRGADEAT